MLTALSKAIYKGQTHQGHQLNVDSFGQGGAKELFFFLWCQRMIGQFVPHCQLEVLALTVEDSQRATITHNQYALLA